MPSGLSLPCVQRLLEREVAVEWGAPALWGVNQKPAPLIAMADKTMWLELKGGTKMSQGSWCPGGSFGQVDNKSPVEGQS